MSVYVDTSVLVAYYVPEPLSARAEAVLVRVRQPAISVLTEVEFASAVSQKARSREIGRESARIVLQRFREHVTGGLFRVVAIEAGHFRQAYTWLAAMNTPLRSLDALHVALAVSESLPIVTSDVKLARAARRLKLRCKYLRPGG